MVEGVLVGGTPAVPLSFDTLKDSVISNVVAASSDTLRGVLLGAPGESAPPATMPVGRRSSPLF